MATIAFDTLKAAKVLKDAGFDDAQAEAVVATVGGAVGEPVTKADLEPLATKAEMAELRASMKAEMADLRTATKVDIAELRAEIAGEFKGLYRHLWMMAAGIVGVTVALVKLIP